MIFLIGFFGVQVLGFQAFSAQMNDDLLDLSGRAKYQYGFKAQKVGIFDEYFSAREPWQRVDLSDMPHFARYDRVYESSEGRWIVLKELTRARGVKVNQIYLMGQQDYLVHLKVPSGLMAVALFGFNEKQMRVELGRLHKFYKWKFGLSASVQRLLYEILPLIPQAHANALVEPEKAANPMTCGQLSHVLMGAQKEEKPAGVIKHCATSALKVLYEFIPFKGSATTAYDLIFKYKIHKKSLSQMTTDVVEGAKAFWAPIKTLIDNSDILISTLKTLLSQQMEEMKSWSNAKITKALCSLIEKLGGMAVNLFNVSNWPAVSGKLSKIVSHGGLVGRMAQKLIEISNKDMIKFSYSLNGRAMSVPVALNGVVSHSAGAITNATEASRKARGVLGRAADTVQCIKRSLPVQGEEGKPAEVVATLRGTR